MIKLHEIIIECKCEHEIYVTNHKLKNDKYSFTCKKYKATTNLISVLRA